MTLVPGTRLGPYDVVSRIGAGAMGEVWRARDERLGRDVAIKVLPEGVAADPDRLQRFTTEARAAGQLNDPNVLTVYDVGTHDRIAYLVTELLEGETLREATTLPLRKAIDYARQIALGLAAAHAKGIVHRDLKPENIFITRDGRVKILDFGLARITESAPADGSLATKMAATNPGTVLGTVGYMAPEQVRGLPADARSDVFALGTILYEMATGRRAFQRDSSADTMAAILREDPPDSAASGVQVPASLDRLIRRCLEKSPDERFQSARDLAFALDALAGGSSSTSFAGMPPADVSDKPAPRRGYGRLLVWAVSVIVVGVAAFAAGRGGWTKAAPPESTHLKQLTFTGGDLGQPALSPDGGTFLFVARSARGNADIFSQRVGGDVATNLTKDSPDDDYAPRFSPDGRLIAFRSERRGGGLYLMGASGESPKLLVAQGFDPAWAPDGKSIVYSTEHIDSPEGRSTKAQLFRIDAAGGTPVKVFDGDAVQPSFSPDGTHLAFWGLPSGSGKRTLFTMPVSGGEPVMLVSDGALNWSPQWSADGKFIYFATDREPPMNLWRLPVDPATGAAAGAPERLTVSSDAHEGLGPEAHGAFVFPAASRMSVIERVPLAGSPLRFSGPAVTVLRASRAVSYMRPSPDGRLLAVVINDGTEDLAVMRSDGSGMIRLTNDAFRDRAPIWSPDSAFIYFMSDRSGHYEVWRTRPDGGALEPATRRKDADRDPIANPVLSPDGKTIAALRIRADQPLGFVDMTRPIDDRIVQPPPSADGVPPMIPLDWLDDGRLVGTTLTAGANRKLVVYAPAMHKVQAWPIPNLAPQAIFQGHDVICADRNGEFVVVDPNTGQARPLTGAWKNPGDVGDGNLGFTAGAMFVVRELREANIWMLTPGGGR